MISMEAIKFNHNPGSATHDAFNIRRNATQFVHVPEWRRFISVNPEDSPAAYAVVPTQGNHITIEVSLTTNDPGLAFVEVRVENHVQGPGRQFHQWEDGFRQLRINRSPGCPRPRRNLGPAMALGMPAGAASPVAPLRHHAASRLRGTRFAGGSMGARSVQRRQHGIALDRCARPCLPLGARRHFEGRGGRARDAKRLRPGAVHHHL